MPHVHVAAMKAAQVAKPNSPLQLVDKDEPEPGFGEVRIKVEACGVCHSDVLTTQGIMPGIQYPRSPGHEIAGTIDAVGKGVSSWKAGARVGVGWHGGHDGTCDSCRRGRFINCVNLRIPGIHYDGGYAEYVVAPIEALARLPDALDFAEAAPLMDAGVTTYNSLRHTNARAGDLVAVQGIGGLGHLALQFANKMGFKTVAIARGKDKEALARKLGAHLYIDAGAEDPAKALQKLGGARAILACAPSAEAAASVVAGLGAEGELMIVGADMQPMKIGLFDLIMAKRNVRGWAAGTSIDSEDTLNFCALAGIRPMIETFPRAKAQEAYDKMMSGQVRFRSVIVR